MARAATATSPMTMTTLSRRSACGSTAAAMVGDGDTAYEWWAQAGGGHTWVPASTAMSQDGLGATQIRVRLADGQLEIYERDKSTQLVPANPRKLDTVDDLTELEHMNEPSAVHVLASRFNQDTVYTWMGATLLAVNPYRSLDKVYGAEVLRQWQTTTQPGRDPHVWNLARMMADTLVREQRNQVALIAGESGAGKTESERLLLRFFTSRGVRGNNRRRPEGVVAAIGASEPLLEAFCNATTRFNDNSSRAGKYTTLMFASGAEHEMPVGAELSIFLPEVSRVSKAPPGERNFHVMYQLLAMDAAKLRARGVNPSPNAHYYLDRSGVFEVPTINDSDGLEATNAALRAVGLDDEQCEAVWDMVAAVLLTGDLAFADGQQQQQQHTQSAAAAAGSGSSTFDDEEAAYLTPESRPALDTVAKTLGVDADELLKTFLVRPIMGGAEHRNTMPEAEAVRDSLAGLVYEQLLHWLVARINDACRPTVEARTVAAHRIGLLDVFGFENFDAVHGNGFNQLMINYANERLQKLYNDIMFRREQTLYTAENIPWPDTGTAPDNSSLIDLFERTGSPSILSLLHDEGRSASGTDAGLLQKMRANHLTRGEARAAPDTFTLLHYAGRVVYSVKGMVDANRCYTLAQHRNMLAASSRTTVQQVMATIAPDAATSGPVSPRPVRRMDALLDANGAGGGVGRRRANSFVGGGGAALSPRARPPTMGAPSDHLRLAGTSKRFSTSLQALLAQLGESHLHFVRCIRPNDTKQPRVLSTARVHEQLRTSGVRTALQVARYGWPGRMPINEFLRRHVPHSTQMDAFMDQFDKTLWRKGKTRIFFKTALLDRLEAELRARQRRAVDVASRQWRAIQLRRRRHALAVLAAALRGYIVHTKATRTLALRAPLGAAAAAWLARHQFRQLRPSPPPTPRKLSARGGNPAIDSSADESKKCSDKNAATTGSSGDVASKNNDDDDDDDDDSTSTSPPLSARHASYEQLQLLRDEVDRLRAQLETKQASLVDVAELRAAQQACSAALDERTKAFEERDKARKEAAAAITECEQLRAHCDRLDRLASARVPKNACDTCSQLQQQLAMTQETAAHQATKIDRLRKELETARQTHTQFDTILTALTAANNKAPSPAPVVASTDTVAILRILLRLEAYANESEKRVAMDRSFRERMAELAVASDSDSDDDDDDDDDGGDNHINNNTNTNNSNGNVAAAAAAAAAGGGAERVRTSSNKSGGGGAASFDMVGTMPSFLGASPRSTLGSGASSVSPSGVVREERLESMMRPVPDESVERCRVAGEAGSIIEMRIRTLCNMLHTARNATTECARQRALADRQRELADRQRAVSERLSQRISELQSTPCATCETHRAQIQELTRAVAQERSTVQMTGHELAKVREELQENESLLTELNEEMSQMRAQNNTLNERIRVLRSEAQDARSDSARFSQLIDRVYALESSILDTLPEQHPMETLVDIALQQNGEFVSQNPGASTAELYASAADLANPEAPGSQGARSPRPDPTWFPSAGVLLSRFLFFLSDTDVTSIVSTLGTMLDDQCERTLRERCYLIETATMLNIIIRREEESATSGRRPFYGQLRDVTNVRINNALNTLSRWLCDQCSDVAYTTLTMPEPVTATPNLYVNYTLVNKLRSFNDDMMRYRMPPWLIAQVFLQLTNLLDTMCFNRYMRTTTAAFTQMSGFWLSINIAPVREWLMSHPMRPLLEEISIDEQRIFARCMDLSRLWQSTKATLADPEVFCTLCRDLTIPQAIHALRIYRPIRDLDERDIPSNVFTAIQSHSARRDGLAPDTQEITLSNERLFPTAGGGTADAAADDCSSAMMLHHIPDPQVFSLRYAYKVDLTLFSAMPSQPAWLEWFNIDTTPSSTAQDVEAKANLSRYARTDSDRAIRHLTSPY